MSDTDIDTAKMAHQLALEQLFNKNQLIPRIRREFETCKDFNFVGYIVHMGIPKDFGLDLLVQMALHKRANMSTMVGVLRRHYADAQEVSDMLLKCAMADLVDWHPITDQFIVKFEVTPDVQEELDRFQFPLPMVVPPRPVRRNTDTGYLMGGGSLLLRHNHHEDDICLDHINRVNAIRFTIDHDTAAMIANRWRNLDRPKEGETKAEFDKRKRAFEKYDRTAKDVITTLSVTSDDFYLTHKYDKRGRTYCQGYHINYQGAPWNKATVQLADKEMVV